MKKEDYEALLDKIVKELEHIEDKTNEVHTSHSLHWLMNNIKGARY